MTAIRAKDMGHLKVLVVEDQIDNVVLIRDMLRQFGIKQMYHAKTGRSALDFINGVSGEVDVVLCDWNMPGMTGVELLKKFRIVNQDTPFVMVTGRSDTASVAEAKKSGVSAYIRKPFSPNELEIKLRVAVHKRKKL